MVEIIKKTKTQKRREERKKSSEANKRTQGRQERRTRQKEKENNDSLNLADFFALPTGKERPEIFCKDCNNWINKEDLIHFCKNEVDLEEFSEDEIETISLAELEGYKEKISEDIEKLQSIQTFQIEKK